MQPLLNIAINAARLAGDVMIRHFDQLERIKVTEKGLQDYFSEVDVKAEQTIINTVHKAYPDHGIIAEETGELCADAETVWIIDPIDGTRNYLHGFPFFAVSIAVRVKDKLEHGVIYDPIRHECFAASRGRGARLNDRRLRVSKQTQLSSSVIGTGFSARNYSSKPAFLPSFETMFGKCASIRCIGSAALNLAYVACGRLDGFWEYGLNSWDIAAGALLVQEAGGFISDLQGGEEYLQQGNVIAGTPKVFKSLLQTLQPTIR